ncbi:hypothetical protein KUTeg_004898 [Tegillarca granosa]|uniref:G-protein coupled receptors family 2 profile 2 domain-containing protein n=1 Tax=Tegillarca granosa TaxID=220873 RepID=A0ABQ9FI96_TEGGR|nr:hypothetical protein KUTeg_004898 [Tegillarca granosa]
MGVKRIDHKLACQIVGVSIHYLTLCTIFWITITSYNMLKKFTKSDRPASPPPEDTPMPLPPKPMLRFYLLGWGVPIIVCGITAAVSIDHYAEPNYCFLAWDPSLGAFYIPVALLVVFNLTFFLRISCVVRGTPNNLNESDDTEEVNDIELTPNPDDTNAEIQALTQSRNNPEHQSSESIASSVMDQERRPITQLYALVAMLFLFIVFWVCGALAVAEPFKSIIPHQETIFSYLYGISCGVFGIFMLAYFCITRKDSCTSWKRFFCCDQQPVYDVDFHVNNHANIPNGHAVPVKNEIECENNKNYNITHELSSNGSQKQSNLTLVPPAPTSDVSLSGGSEKIPNFYNPRQNGIAKKFWEKQKKHSRIITRDMVKDYNESGTDLNFSGSEANRTYNCGSTSDGNNTHLSIEIQIQPNSQKNHQEGNSTCFTGMQGPVGLVNITPNGIPGHKPMFSMLPLERNHIPPVGGSGSPDPTNDSTCCSTVSYSDSSVVPQHIRSPSACSLGMRNHLSAFTPVAPRNNTLPKQSKVNSPSNVSSPTNNYMLRNGSVPRMRDFDGQSQVSDQCPKEQQTRIPPQISYVLPDNGYHRVGAMVNAQPDNAYHRVGGMVNSPKPEDGCTYKQYGSVDDHITCEAPPPDYHQVIRTRSPSGGGGGYSSDASGRQNRSRRKDNNSFIQEVHQRIPNEQNVSTNHSAASPLTPDTQPPHHRKLFTPDSDSQIHYKRNRCNDSDHNSEPTSSVSHRHRHKNRDSHHKHSKHRLPKQRSLEWDSPAKDKRKVIPYAYVNHSYQDKIRQKLQQNPNMSMTDKDGWPLPRSSSNSEKISKQELSRMMEDSSSTSSDDDDAFGNVWVPQKKDKSKKETSV